MHTAVIAAGQATATKSECAATHEVAGPVGFANSSRTATTVADNGFHSANPASHPGMSEVETIVSATMASGKTSEKYFIADSGLVVSSPESAMKYFSLVFPLAMVADTIVSTSLMPGWLAGLAEWNPLSATVVAVRELFANPTGPATSWVAAHSLFVAVAWPAAITAVCIPVALRRLRRLNQ